MNPPRSPRLSQRPTMPPHPRGNRKWLILAFASMLGLGLVPGRVSLAQLTVEITDCDRTPGNLGTVVFTNNSSTTDYRVKLVTAAFRGFPDAVSPSPTCADTSYWERRFPTVITLNGTEDGSSLLVPKGGSSFAVSEHLDLFLPDNFGPTGVPARPASECDHHMLSLSVRFEDAATGTPVAQEAVGSCKACKPGTGCTTQLFPETIVTPNVQGVKRDLVMLTGVEPVTNATNTLGDCFHTTDLSESMLQNRSADTTYQGIYSGRFLCKQGNTSSISGDNAICQNAFAGVEPANEGRAFRGMFRGFRLAPDDCDLLHVNSAGGFPNCCDCKETKCIAPVVVQCGRGVITGKKGAGDTAFQMYEPFVFAAPHLDLEPRTAADFGGSGTNPSLQNLAIDCSGFALSDILGFGEGTQPGNIYAPFNGPEVRFDFDFNDPTPAGHCAGGMNNVVSDVDQNGIADQCQHVDVGQHNFAGEKTTTIRRQVRNTFFDDTDTNTTPPALFGTHTDFEFGGKTVDVSSAGIVSGGQYGERLIFTTPQGLDQTGDLTLVFDQGDPVKEIAVSAMPYHAFDLLFAGSKDPSTSSSSVRGYDLFDQRETDLVRAANNQLASKMSFSPLRGLGVSPFGKHVYSAVATKVFVYDAVARSEVDLDPSTATVVDGREIGQDVNGIAVEPDDQFAYVLAADSSTTPGGGWFAVLRRSDHSLFADPNGVTLFSSIPGTPIDIEARNFGAGTSRTATSYVTSEVLEPGDCPSGGGGGGACGFDRCHEIVPLGPGTMSGFGGETTSTSSTTYHRRLLLSSYDMDRPNFSFAHLLTNRLVLSCTNGFAAPEVVEDFGLDVSADGRIFVVSPDANKLLVVPTNADTGGLDLTNVQTLSLGWRPADVAVALGPTVAGTRKEVAVVVGTRTDGVGVVRIYADTGSLPGTPVDVFIPGTPQPVAVSIKQNGSIAYVAAEGQSAVLMINIAAGTLQQATLPASGLGTLRRVAAQRVAP